MVIGIDGNEANVESRVGVNQYAFELLNALYKLPESKIHTFIIYLRNVPRVDLPPGRENWKYVVLPGSGMWIIKTLMPYLFKKKDGLDLFFTPSHYAPPLAPVRRVCAIMDLGYLSARNQFRAYDYWQLRLWTAWSILVSRKVLTISGATKKDLINHYSFAKNKTEAVLLAGDSSVINTKITKKDINAITKKYALSQKYILFLSTLKPSKNVTGLISAWAQVYKKHPEYKLVIAGKKGWLFEPIFEHVKKLKLKKHVVFTGFVPDADKPALMKGAKLFVLPSFWEGFGIDIVNSMVYGVPVVASRLGSIPEVAGKAGMLVKPENTHEIANALDKVLSMSEKEYNKLSRACIKQAAKFSWDKTARETLMILESI
jgi:glycosyltransferase involved in cell wall biosynthesis